MYGKLSSGLVSSLLKLLKFRFFVEDEGNSGGGKRSPSIFYNKPVEVRIVVLPCTLLPMFDYSNDNRI